MRSFFRYITKCAWGAAFASAGFFLCIGMALADAQKPSMAVSDEFHFSADMPSERVLRFSWKAADPRLFRDALWFKLIYAYEYDAKMTYEGKNLLWYDDPKNGGLSVRFDFDTRSFDAGTAADSYVLDSAEAFPGFVRLCAIMPDDRRVCSREIVDLSKFRARAFPQTVPLSDSELRSMSPFLRIDDQDSVVRYLDSVEAIDPALAAISSALADYSDRLTPSQKTALSSLASKLERKRGWIIHFESADLSEEKSVLAAALSRDDLSADEQKVLRERLNGFDAVLADLEIVWYVPPDAKAWQEFLRAADRALDDYARWVRPADTASSKDNENNAVADPGASVEINKTAKKNVRSSSGNLSVTKNASGSDTQRTATVSFSASIRDSVASSASILFGYLLVFLLALAGTGFMLRGRRVRIAAPAVVSPSLAAAQTPAAATPTDVLRIFRTGNEYRIEYREFYERSVKVLEENRRSVLDGIGAFVSSMNRLAAVRGRALDELASLQVSVPSLETSGNAIYRLFLPENIRDELSRHSGNLVIRTDEQEIPWELMHDGAKFLALSYPVVRGVLVSGEMRANPVVPHDRLKALFIVNPTDDLPGTEREAEAIILNMEGLVDMTVVRGKDVNVTNLVSLLGQSWDIVHYAGHAVHDRATPDESGLVLAAGQMLTVTEIKRSLGGNPLIFINACSSGAASEVSTEAERVDRVFDVDPLGSVGIATAFMVGGAKGVVSTMWPVTDSAASDFATRFYSHLLAEEPVGAALTSSKQYLRSRDPADVTWSAFIYYGSPEERLSRPKSSDTP